MVDDDTTSLSCGGEIENNGVFGEVSLSKILEIDVVVSEELKESNIGLGSRLWLKVGVVIAGKVKTEIGSEGLWGDSVERKAFHSNGGFVFEVRDVDAVHSHLVLSEGSSLIRADGICASHSFASIELSDEVAVFQHLLGRVSESDGNSKRKTFRNAGNSSGQTDKDVVDKFAVVDFSSWVQEASEEEFSEEDTDDGDSSNGTIFSNGFSDVVKLDLEWSRVVFTEDQVAHSSQ